MYKPSFRTHDDVFAMLDFNGVLQYITPAAFFRLIDTDLVARSFTFSLGDGHIDDYHAQREIALSGGEYTAATLNSALETYAPDTFGVDAVLELHKRLPQVDSFNILALTAAFV